MNYSNNINKLMHNKDDKDITETIKEINENIAKTLRNSSKLYIKDETPVLPEPVNVDTTQEVIPDAPGTPGYSPDGNDLNAVSPAYVPEESTKSTPDYYEKKELENGVIQVQPKYNYPDDLGYYYLNLSPEEKQSLLNKPFEEKVAYLREVKERKLKELADKPTPDYEEKTKQSSILEVQEPEKEPTESSASVSGEKKSVTIQEPAAAESSESTSSNETRKFIL
jgi:hypothetical protein